mmetsp:Transcript_23571/g.65380  ORF Transcript_23571/g.65380 Transcript_23571/m.65380 type:complete len:152 (-) Transcript_23571:1281-1736(-)
MAAASHTHYDALGVTPQATADEIKAAYKAAALLHHPDKKSASTADESARISTDFASIQSAWEVLRDPKARLIYDHQLSLKQTASNTPISEVLDLSDMDTRLEDGQYWYWHLCRCGGSYEVPEDELDPASSSVLVGCGSCSLFIQVTYHSCP